MSKYNMTILELRFKPHKRIRRTVWREKDYLTVMGWDYNGTEWAYGIGGGHLMDFYT